ncbi:DUF805 domain-containing protein [Lactobacillus ultunensis]|uniref:DUF805 domain-containing protein n=1 Tax=Lactobacillus ultunensis DSM 16047 TaxID=525365 RepID=C2EK24_9LACO|nr:DUF805 domain-containing protein [Lactobacillus ultunensis]EEJ73039.1 hypothetical protein HMPREF0548_0020 [Lactobacillus ultunensis DSM 16047]KRL82691.1 hypothetical protein FC57_GL001465 [Lactobacillus ultunensis DSM 16047]QQP29441.1 DUF805 domain-containing protein [Lactobacillus ultunensis]
MNKVPLSTWTEILQETFLHPFTWKARTSIRTYWSGWLILALLDFIPGIYLLIMGVVPLFLVGLHQPGAFDISWYIAMAIAGVINLYFFLCKLGLMIRRLHDSGRNGVWAWLTFIPVAGVFIWLYLMLQSPTFKPIKWDRYLVKNR